MKDIRVIIPLHILNDDVKELITKAIKSVPNDIPLLISTAKNCFSDVEKFITEEKEFSKYKIEVISIKTAETDFCPLVNLAVHIIDEKWFTILEYDDTYTDIWFDNVEKYTDSYQDTSMFLPLVNVFDYKTELFVSFINEMAWSSSFAENIGNITKDSLTNFFNFNVTGAVISTDDWESTNGLNPYIKMTFWYEFLLRFANLNKKMMVIPKLGYNHYLGRPKSLMDEYSKEMDENEVKFWFKTAKEQAKLTKREPIIYNAKKELSK